MRQVTFQEDKETLSGLSTRRKPALNSFLLTSESRSTNWSRSQIV